MSSVPASIRGIRPAQAGIVMRGRPTCGHISATIVDLALRDVMHVEQLSRPEQVPHPYRPLISFARAWTARCESLPGRRPHLTTSEPQTSYSEHYQPPPSGGADMGGIGF